MRSTLPAIGLRFTWQLNTLMRPRAGADLVQQRDGSLLEQACADAAEHVIRALPLQNDIVDAVSVQQLPKQQSGRSGPDDCDFCPQYLLLPIL